MKISNPEQTTILDGAGNPEHAARNPLQDALNSARNDILGRIDSLEVGRGGAEVSVPELALDEIHGDALAGQLNRMGVSKLVRSETATNPSLDGKSA